MKKNVVHLFICMLLLTIACTDDKETRNQYDPSKPIVITTFSPDSGGIATQMIIKGQNFGTDPSAIRVWFNKKQAKVLNSTGELIYLLVPRQPGDESDISIAIGNDSITYKDKQFRYLLSANVSTLVGHTNPDGSSSYKAGTLAEAMFEGPRYVNCDNEGNVFVADHENRVCLVSPENNSVITLDENIPRPVGGCTSTDGKRVYISDYYWSKNNNDRHIFCYDPDRQWTPLVIPTGVKGEIDWVLQLAVDENDIFYVPTESGDFYTIDAKNATFKCVLKGCFTSPGYNCCAYSPKDKRVYFADRNAEQILYWDIRTQEMKVLAGVRSERGHRDGPGKQALFYFPYQLAVDPDGNVLVADYYNHCIRKVTPEGYVSTVAGVPGESGFRDGDPDQALFDNPKGVCVDQNGTIYVADEDNYRIRKIIIE